MPYADDTDKWFYKRRWNEIKGMSERNAVAYVLSQGRPVCGTMFYRLFLPQYSQRISELRAWYGYNIRGGDLTGDDAVSCPYPHHTHTKRMGTYQWAPEPEEDDDGE
jgi:hypothetical protein